MRERLDPLIIKRSPLSVPVKKPKATWVQPVAYFPRGMSLQQLTAPASLPAAVNCRRDANEIQLGDFTQPLLYRMHLRQKDSFRQHIALQKLENDGNRVFYVTSQIASFEDLSRAYTRHEMNTPTFGSGR